MLKSIEANITGLNSCLQMQHWSFDNDALDAPEYLPQGSARYHRLYSGEHGVIFSYVDRTCAASYDWEEHNPEWILVQEEPEAQPLDPAVGCYGGFEYRAHKQPMCNGCAFFKDEDCTRPYLAVLPCLAGSRPDNTSVIWLRVKPEAQPEPEVYTLVWGDNTGIHKAQVSSYTEAVSLAVAMQGTHDCCGGIRHPNGTVTFTWVNNKYTKLNPSDYE